MRDHLLGMDTGIGSTGEGESHGFAQDGSESRFHFRLHRVSVRLRLRTVEIRAVI